MLTDHGEEPPAARRLLAFAALFLGMLTLSQAVFAGGVSLLSPPLIAIVIVLLAIGGVMVWVNGRWARGLLWPAVGLLWLLAAATALLSVNVTWAAMLLILFAMDTTAAAGYMALRQWRPGFAPDWERPAVMVMLVAAVLIAVLAAPAGRGAAIAVVAGSAGLLIIWLLRPVPSE